MGERVERAVSERTKELAGRGPAEGESPVEGGERLVRRVEAGGERLDVWLSRLESIPSRAFAKRLIDEGKVWVNGRPAAKAGVKVREGDTVEVYLPPPEPSTAEPEAIPLDIVYEDEHILVINKPAGMVVHPAPGHTKGTLVNALLYHVPDLAGVGGVKRPGIVHRLDKETSGLLVVAKSGESLVALARQMKERRIMRRYLALVHGVVAVDAGTVDAPIGRHPVKRQQMAVVPDGRPAVTHFRVLERMRNATYLSLRLETGRTHQIRVHMAFIGHPVIGDDKYGRADPHLIEYGHALHAAELAFEHPITGRPMEFRAPLPAAFEACLEKLRRGAEPS